MNHVFEINEINTNFCVMCSIEKGNCNLIPGKCNLTNYKHTLKRDSDNDFYCEKCGSIFREDEVIDNCVYYRIILKKSYDLIDVSQTDNYCDFMFLSNCPYSDEEFLLKSIIE